MSSTAIRSLGVCGISHVSQSHRALLHILSPATAIPSNAVFPVCVDPPRSSDPPFSSSIQPIHKPAAPTFPKTAYPSLPTTPTRRDFPDYPLFQPARHIPLPSTCRPPPPTSNPHPPLQPQIRPSPLLLKPAHPLSLQAAFDVVEVDKRSVELSHLCYQFAC